MATFQIHADVENVDGNGGKDSKTACLLPEECRKRPMRCCRNALQTVNNVVKHDAKRAKIAQEITDSIRVISIQNTERVYEEETKENVENILNLDCVKLSDANVKFEDNIYKDTDAFSLNLLYNREYRHDIWEYLKRLEEIYDRPIRYYMKRQQHIDYSMRCVVVDWLVAVAEEYQLNEETLHLAVNYVDRFLSKMSVIRDKFQLVGSVAMMVAGKVEEIYPPDTKEWAYLSNNVYSTHEIFGMEQLLLKVLKFDMQPPTIFSFIKLLCSEHGLDEKTLFLAMYLSELVLLEGENYFKYFPSKLAASSVALARITLSEKDPWPKDFEISSGYTLRQLSRVVVKQNQSFKDSPTKCQQSVQTKYGAKKYHRVALLKPKCVFLEGAQKKELSQT